MVPVGWSEARATFASGPRGSRRKEQLLAPAARGAHATGGPALSAVGVGVAAGALRYRAVLALSRPVSFFRGVFSARLRAWISVSRPLSWCLLLSWLGAGSAVAQPVRVMVEGFAAAPLTAPQADAFGFGGGLSVGFLCPALSKLSVGARVRGLWLTDRDATLGAHIREPGSGGHLSLAAALRTQPFAHGLFMELAPGVGRTGELTRAHLEVALGYGLRFAQWQVAPFLRYLQIIQVGDALSDEDARLALLGVEVSLGGEPPVVPPAAPVAVAKPTDRDGDGLTDEQDGCPSSPEDADGYQDDDGCPDDDDDSDGIPDARDLCPRAAEDIDGFEDEDGCPEADNDQDGVPDASDACPMQAEVVNGNSDEDGCPDAGLVEFRHDRIVLEETVLFDLERARVKTAAKPTLQAIVRLKQQHPEWTKVRIEGHTDARGDDDYNLDLSERRAQRVMEALIALGLSSDLMVAQGFGASRPRDDGDSEDAHQRNRRVEFVVIARRPVLSMDDGVSAPENAPAAGAGVEREGQP